MSSTENSTLEALSTVVNDASSAIKSLEAIRQEHERQMALANGKPPVTGDTTGDCSSNAAQQEKVNVLRKSMEKIVLYLDETQVVLLLATHLQQTEEKATKLEAQVDRLCDENEWLRTELSVTQQRLNESEAKISQLEEEKAHLVFMEEHRLNDDSEQPQASLSSPVKASVSESLASWGGQRSIDSNDVVVAGQPAGGMVRANSTVSECDDNPPQKLRTLHALVSQYSQQGRFDVAVPLCKQALEDAERTNGFFHTEVATLMNMLALLYRDQGKLEESCDLLCNTVRIKEHCLGANHPSVASTLNNLSVLYGKRGMWEEAHQFCKQGLAIREALYGHEHGDVAKLLSNLALICQNRGQYTESEDHYLRAIDMYTKLLGPGDPATTKTMNNLAACYLKQKKHDEAKALYRQVLHETTQVQTSFGSSGAAGQQTGNSNAMPPTSPTLDGGDLHSEKPGTHRQADGEEAMPRTFDISRLVSTSPVEDVFMSGANAHQFPISPGAARSQGSTSAASTPGGRTIESTTPLSAAEEPAKRVSSFSRLRGSVGRALGRVIAAERSNNRRSSLSRQGSDSEIDAASTVSTDSPSRSPHPSQNSSIAASGSASVTPTPSRQQLPVVLASQSSVSRPNSQQSDPSTPVPRRGPLRAYHHDSRDDGQ